MTFNEFSTAIERAFIPVNGERDKIAYLFLGSDVVNHSAINATCGTVEELANMICIRMCENEQFANAVEAAWSTYILYKQTQSRSN